MTFLLTYWRVFATAATVAIASDHTVTITATDEPCQLDTVDNLQFRATWAEDGKTLEGCIGPSFDDEWLLGIFDKHVVLLPKSIFKRAEGA